MNVVTLLLNAARTFGECPAIRVGDRQTHTYQQLQDRVVRLSAALRDRLSLKTGDRVALVMSNRPAYLEILFAIWHAGLVAVPVNAKLHPKEVAFILQDCGAVACFVTEDVADGIARHAAGSDCLRQVICVDHSEYAGLSAEPVTAAVSDRDDLAWLFYTSGTTGRPKGAMLSHLNLQLMCWSYLCDFDLLTEQDSMLHLGPQSHGAGLLALAHVAKGSQHVLPDSGSFDPGEVASIVDRTPNVTFFAAPTMLHRLVDHAGISRCHVENIRSILGGGAPFYANDVRRVLATFGARFTNGYGQGECPCTITAMPKRLYCAAWDDELLVSVGIPRTGVEVRVIDSANEELPDGQVGEIAVRSDIVMRGYWRNASATAAALETGWLRTGDLGSRNERGFFWLKDRSKDLIISGGSNIYPREVEDVLLMSDAVAEVAVVGETDPDWGESAVAFVVLRDGHTSTAADLDRLCLENLARFKRPKRYEFLTALPRNSTGKIQKTELRARLASEATGKKNS
ncbi:MAG: AMP-dependent synthetase [Gammaproteobacteria bacterium]|jgi:long-chain acyl-CoA synthetase|nr:AMP-dependent synthetase [Gammaproteobacteria bacterium]